MVNSNFQKTQLQLPATKRSEDKKNEDLKIYEKINYCSFEYEMNNCVKNFEI